MQPLAPIAGGAGDEDTSDDESDDPIMYDDPVALKRFSTMAASTEPNTLRSIIAPKGAERVAAKCVLGHRPSLYANVKKRLSLIPQSYDKEADPETLYMHYFSNPQQKTKTIHRFYLMLALKKMRKTAKTAKKDVNIFADVNMEQEYSNAQGNYITRDEYECRDLLEAVENDSVASDNSDEWWKESDEWWPESDEDIEEDECDAAADTVNEHTRVGKGGEGVSSDDSSDVSCDEFDAAADQKGVDLAGKDVINLNLDTAEEEESDSDESDDEVWKEILRGGIKWTKS